MSPNLEEFDCEVGGQQERWVGWQQPGAMVITKIIENRTGCKWELIIIEIRGVSHPLKEQVPHLSINAAWESPLSINTLCVWDAWKKHTNN